MYNIVADETQRLIYLVHHFPYLYDTSRVPILLVFFSARRRRWRSSSELLLDIIFLVFFLQRNF